jgi:cytochrome c oxidase subunit 3
MLLHFYILIQHYILLQHLLKSIILLKSNNLIRLIFYNYIHLEVAIDSLYLIINSSYLLVFILISYFIITFLFNISTIIIFSIFMFTFITSIYLWFRDLLRELYIRYELYYFYLMIIFDIFLSSELLLFISLFYTYFYLISSITLSILSYESLYLLDPCQLSFINIYLLSNAAINSNISFINLEITFTSFYIFIFIYILYYNQIFINIQIQEFNIISLLLNDSIYSCLFFFLTGLHFFHLIIGLFLLSLLFWSCSFLYFLISLISYSTTPKDKDKGKDT